MDYFWRILVPQWTADCTVITIKMVSSILSLLSLALLPGGQSPCLFTRLWVTLTLSTSLSKPLLHSEWQTILGFLYQTLASNCLSVIFSGFINSEIFSTSHSAGPPFLSISKLYKCYYVAFPFCCLCVLTVTDLDLHILDSSKHVNVVAFAYQHLIPAYWNSLTSQLLLFNTLSNPTCTSTSKFHILMLFPKFAALHLQKNML